MQSITPGPVSKPTTFYPGEKNWDSSVIPGIEPEPPTWQASELVSQANAAQLIVNTQLHYARPASRALYQKFTLLIANAFYLFYLIKY